MDHFGDDKEAVEISDSGCCTSCDWKKDHPTYEAKEDIILLLNAVEELHPSDRTERKVRHHLHK